MNTKEFSRIIESKFLFEASKLGYTVSQPFGDTAPYDFILDDGNNLVKVQCKSMRKTEDYYVAETHRKTGHRRDTKISYVGTVDMFFLYNVDDDLCVFIPVEDCGKSATTFRKKFDTTDSRIRFIESYPFK